MNEQLPQLVRNLARGRCEYCLIPEEGSRLGHVIDHISARQHHGKTELPNLALACGHCNSAKGPNVAGFDPQTGDLSRLFHPRQDRWSDHFRYEGPLLVGLTAIGRTTVDVLGINSRIRLVVRRVLMESGAMFVS